MELKLKKRTKDESPSLNSKTSKLKPGSQTPSITRAQKKRNQVSLSPLSPRTNLQKISYSNQSHAHTSNRISVRCPAVGENLTKIFDISQKSLKHNPARFLMPQYREKHNESKFNSPTIDSDLQLLKEINQKNDHELFDLDQILTNLGYCCRHETAYIHSKEKRVRFQLF